MVARCAGGCRLDEGPDGEAAAVCPASGEEKHVPAGVCTVRIGAVEGLCVSGSPILC